MCHDMAGAVPENFLPFRGVECDDFSGAVGREWSRQVNGFAVNLDGDCFTGKPAPYFKGYIHAGAASG